MKAFLSHASEVSDVARRIALALTESGHEAFFDRDALEPGEAYNRRIREEIASCDLFVFLISRDSLREGSYARSELEFAMRRWRHPDRRVLPVLLEKIPLDEVPAFLTAVTVLDPVGDVVAETAQAVEELARGAGRRRRKRWAIVGAAGIAVVGGAWWQRTHDARPALGVQVTDGKLQRLRRDFERKGDVYVVHATIANRGSTPRTVMGLEIECSSADVVVRNGDGGEFLLAAGEARRLELPISFVGARDGDLLYEADLPELRWRLSAPVYGDATRTTEWSAFRPEGVFENGALDPLAASTRGRVRFVAQSDEGPRDSLTLAVVDPPELWDMSSTGELRRLASLPGAPSALAVGDSCVAVGTESPAGLSLWVGPTYEPRGPYELVAIAVSGEPDDARTYSVLPRSLAVIKDEVWVRSQDRPGRDGLPFLSRLDLESETITVPFPKGSPQARAEISNVSDGLTLRVIDGEIFGVTSDTGPGSVVATGGGEFATIGGHDVPLVSCANEIAPAPGGGFLLVDCDSNLARAVFRNGTLERVQSLGQLALPEDAMHTWKAQRISVCRERVLVALTVFAQSPKYESVVTRLFTWTPASGVRLLAAVERCETISIATLENSGCAVLRTADGSFQAVRMDYANE